MSSSIASTLLRRTLRLHSSSSSSWNLCRHPRPLFYSSLASSSLTRTAIIPRSLDKPSSLLPLRLVSSRAGGAAEKLNNEMRSDEKLKQVLETEIDCAEQDQCLEVTLPDEFPFEITDNSGDQTIILKREFAGESIEAVVFMNLDEADEEDGENNSGDEDSNDAPVQPSISIVVTIDKGEVSVLEFCCSLNDDGLSIESMATKKRDDPDDQRAYQGPVFSDLDESLQKPLHKYLEARGIKSSFFDFLQQYMMNKDDREYTTWLKNMKKFLET